MHGGRRPLTVGLHMLGGVHAWPEALSLATGAGSSSRGRSSRTGPLVACRSMCTQQHAEQLQQQGLLWLCGWGCVLGIEAAMTGFTQIGGVAS